MLVIFIEDTFGHRVRWAVIPARVIRMVINTHRHNDTGADISAAPLPRAGQKLAPDEKITVGHTGRYKIIHIYGYRVKGLRKQDGKTFLREVMIVGQDFRETFAAHGLHGNAIREAIGFIRLGFIKRHSLKK